ncbi:STAS domain-containing protein [Streptomyces sp. NPDC002104]
MTPHAPASPTPQEAAIGIPRLCVSVSSSVGEVLVTISGDVDLDRAPDLRSILTAVLCSSEGPLTLDLENVTFCDCSGLNEFLRARVHAEAVGRPLTIRAVSRPVARLLELTGTDKLFHPAERDTADQSRVVQPADPDGRKAALPGYTADGRLIGDTFLVTLHGELDLSGTQKFLPAIPAQTVAVVVDMRDVSFMDLSGLRFLAALEQRTNEQGAVLLTIGWQPGPLLLTETVARSRRAFPALSRYVQLRQTRELRAALMYRAALRRAVGIAEARSWEESAKALAQTCAPPGPRSVL